MNQMLVGIHTPISYLHTMHYNILYVWFWLHGARLQCTPYEFCRNLRPYNSFSIYQAFFLGHPQAGSRQEMHSEKNPLWKKIKFFHCWTFFAVVPFHFGDIFCSKVYLLLYYPQIIYYLYLTDQYGWY